MKCFKYKHFATTGKGKYNTMKDKLAHRKWVDMLRRCYGNENPSYIDCTVCEEWLSFQNFADWYYNNYVEGWFLDKDILCKGNKVYSPDTCCFVPHLINSQFKIIPAKKCGVTQGVRKRFNKFLVRYDNVYIGSFNTEQEASICYYNNKLKVIKNLAEKFKSQLSHNVYKTLINYE